MRLAWLRKGLRTGVVTTRYPAAEEPQPVRWRGRPVLDPAACRAPDGCTACLAVCLPEALRVGPRSGPAIPEAPADLILDYGRCIMCGLCVPACPAGALAMAPDYELAARSAGDLRVTVSWMIGDQSRDARR
jgi:formate hydrogenlyase subunit 6/NADH:ubiquinone oxidoreductase subunit I